jgi:hypothetical protein
MVKNKDLHDKLQARYGTQMKPAYRGDFPEDDNRPKFPQTEYPEGFMVYDSEGKEKRKKLGELYLEKKDDKGNLIVLETAVGNVVAKYTEEFVILDVFKSDNFVQKESPKGSGKYVDTNSRRCYIKADIGKDTEDIWVLYLGEPSFFENLLETKRLQTEEPDKGIGFPCVVSLELGLTKAGNQTWKVRYPSGRISIPKSIETEDKSDTIDSEET